LNPTDLVWSPDGTRIAFAEQAFQLLREGDLWLMDAATGRLTNLTDDGATRRLPMTRPSDVAELFVDVSPAWTPDGRAIAVSRTVWRDGDWRGNELAVVDVETGRVESIYQVTPEAIGVVTGPMAWSADGSKLYYSVLTQAGDDPERGIWVFDRDTGQAELVVATGTNATDYPFRAVSPRGDLLLTASTGADSQFASPAAYLDLVDLAGQSVTPLTVAGADDADLARIRLVAFSPDGSMLVLVVTSPSAPFTQAIVRDLGTGTETVLIADLPEFVAGFVGQTVQWSANGTVYVPSAAPGIGTLLRLDTGAATPEASA
jgi:Tol biopolymer transport system component